MASEWIIVVQESSISNEIVNDEQTSTHPQLLLLPYKFRFYMASMLITQAGSHQFLIYYLWAPWAPTSKGKGGHLTPLED